MVSLRRIYSETIVSNDGTDVWYDGAPAAVVPRARQLCKIILFDPAAESSSARQVAPGGSPRHRPPRQVTGLVRDETTVTVKVRA